MRILAKKKRYQGQPAALLVRNTYTELRLWSIRMPQPQAHRANAQHAPDARKRNLAVT